MNHCFSVFLSLQNSRYKFLFLFIFLFFFSNRDNVLHCSSFCFSHLSLFRTSFIAAFLSSCLYKPLYTNFYSYLSFCSLITEKVFITVLPSVFSSFVCLLSRLFCLPVFANLQNSYLLFVFLFVLTNREKALIVVPFYVFPSERNSMKSPFITASLSSCLYEASHVVFCLLFVPLFLAYHQRDKPLSWFLSLLSFVDAASWKDLLSPLRFYFR